ncbi:MAG: tetratricopeptide repeat protein, partial [Hyphomicrobiales bacterium]|nr:tetratricopeptide repeat protein [Hyphomicrobiales bacterium]
LEQFNLALSSDSERAEIFLNQGNSLFLLKDFTGALEKYEDSLEYNIEDISAVYYNKGLVYEKMGNTDQAILFYNKAVSINPGLMSRFDNRIRLDKS